MKKGIISFILIVVSVGFFYFFGEYVNYPIHQEIKYNAVNHPEFIPTVNTVKLSSAGFGNLVSDFYWLSAIQYIGSNAIGAEYKKYLYVMLNLITDLNPYFTYPYQIGELLIPSYNERYEDISKEEQNKNNSDGLKLGLKGVEKNCDKTKVELIKKEFDLKKLWTEEKYANPCSDPMIPYFLAYIYYWNFFDGIKSAEYYKITSANKNAVSGARIMAAIMQGKGGDREKSILMFLSLAESMGVEKTKSCNEFSQELKQVLIQIFQNKAVLNGKFLQKIEEIRKDILNKLNESDADSSKTNIENLCSNYLNKAVREINLMYLDQADKRYFTDKKIHAKDTKELFANKYIDYFPRDFQKQDETTEIIYFFNQDTGNWDYKMGAY